jgi:hypothetical protein
VKEGISGEEDFDHGKAADDISSDLSGKCKELWG